MATLSEIMATQAIKLEWLQIGLFWLHIVLLKGY